ncbi:MAG TPA: LiaF domain-containing protein [Chitinophagaceae bacterium]
MTEFENRKDERRPPEAYRSDRSSHIWTGVFILLIGVVALLRNTMTDFPDWLFSWQTLLIALGLFIGLRHKFKGVAWFILIIVGGVFLMNEIYPELTFRRYMWPMALIAVGLFFILRPRGRFRSHWHESRGKGEYRVSGGFNMDDCGQNQVTEDDFVDATSIFGGTKKNILSKNFKGGDIVNVFGGTELNLSQADVNGTAVLELTTIFGGTKLIVPSNWSVKPEAVTIFGGIEDKRQMPSSSDAPEKTLVLKGTVIFGGIDIKSF